jgi:lysylphosphatidylglycerol synthetase-like protein (DUF2156 family)
MQRTFYQLYRALAWLFVAGAVIQFFLAGLGVFGAASFGPHMTVGKLLWLASLILLVLAAILALSGGLSRGRVGLAALLFVLMVVQWSLIEAFSKGAPALAALHPVNGLLVLSVAFALARGFELPTSRSLPGSRG